MIKLFEYDIGRGSGISRTNWECVLKWFLKLEMWGYNIKILFLHRGENIYIKIRLVELIKSGKHPMFGYEHPTITRFVN